MTPDHAWNPVILVVEDDPIIGELLKLRLEAARYRPHWVQSGEQALSVIHEVQPSLVLLDLGLPRMDGFQVLTEIRRQAVFARTPVVVLTARHNVADVQRALKLGANDFMAKPFDAAALLNRLTKHLAARAKTPTGPN
jgi:DNA-binding response OmpR family regulator